MSASDLERERRRLTLDQLEGVASTRPPIDTYLASTCYRLRSKPIGDFTTEDLRIMIGQGQGLFFLVPIAIQVLDREPLASGDLYTGDLLCGLLEADPVFWAGRRDLRSRVDALVHSLPTVPEEVAESLQAWRR